MTKTKKQKIIEYINSVDVEDYYDRYDCGPCSENVSTYLESFKEKLVQEIMNLDV